MFVSDKKEYPCYFHVMNPNVTNRCETPLEKRYTIGQCCCTLRGNHYGNCDTCPALGTGKCVEILVSANVK